MYVMKEDIRFIGCVRWTLKSILSQFLQPVVFKKCFSVYNLLAKPGRMLIQSRLENGTLATQTLRISCESPPRTLQILPHHEPADSQCVATHLDDLVSLRISSNGSARVLPAHCSAMSPKSVPLNISRLRGNFGQV